MNKLLSLHPNKCNTACNNAHICYMLSRNKKVPSRGFINEAVISNKIMKYIKANNNVKVYIAVCNFEDGIQTIQNMHSMSNINMTINYRIYKDICTYIEGISKNIEERIQVSTYNTEQIKDISDNTYALPLYLIKNEVTLEEAINLLMESKYRAHLNIYQGFVEKQLKMLFRIINEWTMSNSTDISIDTCLESYLIHRTCLYKDYYIDIDSYNQVRRCPFEKGGEDIRDREIRKLYNIKYQPNCIYKRIFGGN